MASGSRLLRSLSILAGSMSALGSVSSVTDGSMVMALPSANTRFMETFRRTRAIGSDGRRATARTNPSASSSLLIWNMPAGTGRLVKE